MKTNDANLQRCMELAKQKRRLLDTMKKHRKALAKARAEKKKINEEITKLRKSGYAFHGMTATEAMERVKNEIKSVKPLDIYPKDLEKKFDKLERDSEVKYKKGSVDIADIDGDASEATGHDYDDSPNVIDSGLGVIDLSDSSDEDDSLGEMS